MLLNDYALKQRFITCGGESLYGVKSNNVEIINAYGPTECTNHSATFTIELGKNYGCIPIGRPLQNTQCLILDSNFKLLPQEVIGELCIAGPQLALGYYNNPGLTAERFTNITVAGKVVKIYKTGDLCRWNAEGQLEYIGRIDNQVKLRGFRIELGEIESVALQVEGVQQSVAIVRNEQIVLYYTGDVTLDASYFVSLPEYMIPSAYMQLDAMPLTPNGKIDRRSLPEPEYKAESITLPATRDEQQVLEIVEGIMKISPISVTANLISLGLSSIAAMRLAMRLSKELDRNISMSQLMSMPNVRDIAANLSVTTNSGFGQVHEKQEYYPLTDNQLGVYLDWEQHREGLQYNIPCVIKLKGGGRHEQCQKNADSLKCAIETIVSAHSYLKSRLVVVNGEVMLQRRDEDTYRCNITSLNSKPDIGFFQSCVHPFNLFEDSLCRFEIYTHGEDIYLFRDIHHIITDGLSNARLTSEIFKAYSGEAIEPETFTAFDRAVEEFEIKQTSIYALAEGYYKNLLT